MLPTDASLTVYSDRPTGLRIALAVGRTGRAPAPVAWRRLASGGLDDAVSAALRAARNRPAFAVVLPGEGSGDGAEAALARCLARADLDGLVPGPEVPVALAVAAE